MAYLGRQPTIGNFQVCDAISVVNGQAAYTMQVGGVNVSPESANHMIVSLNGVIQKPTDAYTVSNSVITFASNLVTGDVIDFIQILGNVLDLGVPSDNTVTTAKLSDSSVSLAKLTATGTKDATTFLRGDNSFQEVPAGGITEADMFRITADFSSSADPVSSNWERVDDASFSKIGTGMTNSSGIWSFPTTGLYKVQFNIHGYTYNTTVNNELWTTINNSTYTREAIGRGGDADGYYFNVEIHIFVNVTDTSNVKVKARVDAGGTWNVYGNTNQNETYLTFIRLGDSQ